MPTHSGQCHCGAVSFTFEAPAEISMTECNCSICSKTAYQHIFVPQDNVTINGQENLATYRFNTDAAQHLFCKTCGIKPLYIPRSHPEDYSINYRCVTPGTLSISDVILFNGQNWEDGIDELKSKT